MTELAFFCSSYSSTLHKIHQYQDGLKVFSYTYIDEVEDPMPSDTFKNLLIGKNMRGLLTDLNIYSSFFDDDAMIDWTKGCAQKEGDIFAFLFAEISIYSQFAAQPCLCSVLGRQNHLLNPLAFRRPSVPVGTLYYIGYI